MSCRFISMRMMARLRSEAISMRMITDCHNRMNVMNRLQNRTRVCSLSLLMFACLFVCCRSSSHLHSSTVAGIHPHIASTSHFLPAMEQSCALFRMTHVTDRRDARLDASEITEWVDALPKCLLFRIRHESSIAHADWPMAPWFDVNIKKN